METEHLIDEKCRRILSKLNLPLERTHDRSKYGGIGQSRADMVLLRIVVMIPALRSFVLAARLQSCAPSWLKHIQAIS
jgi:hypothetical protein